MVKCRSQMGSENALSTGTWRIVWMLPATDKDGRVLSLHILTAESDSETETSVTNKNPHLLSACCMLSPVSSTWSHIVPSPASGRIEAGLGCTPISKQGNRGTGNLIHLLRCTIQQETPAPATGLRATDTPAPDFLLAPSCSNGP